MKIVYSVLLFIYGTIFGSFFNVVGDRLTCGQSIVSPPSHCPKCLHRLTAIELIPVLSYVMQGGRCKNCHCKIPVFHPLFEIFVGLMFMLCYLSFGLTGEGAIALIFISMLCILIVSDIYYMIIPDEILLFFGFFLGAAILVNRGVVGLMYGTLCGIICFGVMYLIKVMGDRIFKRESMGGGDIKLLFVFGLVLGWQNGLSAIFVGSMIGLPISVFLMSKNKSNVIPFGPFLSLGAIVLLLTHFNFDVFLNVLVNH